MNAIGPAFGCASGALAVEAARERVLRLAPAMLTAEAVPLAECMGRILAEPFAACMDLPGFDQSAMDGYAVRRADLTPGASLPVTGRSAAGDPPGVLAAGGVHRILTGAPLPAGADTVLAQESVYRDGDLIGIGGIPASGAHVRRRGEDMRCGQPLIAAGTMLDWRHAAVLAAQGAAAVTVRRRPRVVVLSSGQELRMPGQVLAPGQIHDSNLPMLAALLRQAGAEVQPMAIVADNAAAMQAALRSAAAGADLVITTAGISVGDEDHVRDAVDALGGSLSVLSVAMKPGKPLAAGRIGDAVFIGLPGNPVAALAGTMAFVWPLLARMTGAPPIPALRAHAAFDMDRRPGRTEFVPVRLHHHAACLWAGRIGPDGSGRLAKLPDACGFAVIPAHDVEIRRGVVLEIMPFMPGLAVPAGGLR